MTSFAVYIAIVEIVSTKCQNREVGGGQVGEREIVVGIQQVWKVAWKGGVVSPFILLSAILVG